ncbi:MAG TPA: hypothetical protein DIC22_12800 [Chitinophagaceae bacterium]|nr:hypothetical protein [Chitinophagaceae bacterium]
MRLHPGIWTAWGSQKNEEALSIRLFFLPGIPLNINEKATSSGSGFFQFVKPGNSKCTDDHEGIGFHLKGPVFNDTGFWVFIRTDSGWLRMFIG